MILKILLCLAIYLIVGFIITIGASYYYVKDQEQDYIHNESDIMMISITWPLWVPIVLFISPVVIISKLVWTIAVNGDRIPRYFIKKFNKHEKNLY